MARVVCVSLAPGELAPDFRVVLTRGAFYTPEDDPAQPLLLIFLRHLA